MPQINYYFSVLSPFTYLSGLRLEEIAAKHGADIQYKPLDIMALFARTGGTPPKDRHPNRIDYRMQELVRAATKTGLPMNFNPAHWPTNAAPASYAIIAAANAGGGDLGALCHSVLRAVWAEEKDIAQDDVIAQCLVAAGYEASLINSGMLTGAEQYARNLEEAIDAGAFGAPFYITDGDARFWGHDRLDDLDAHLSGDL